VYGNQFTSRTVTYSYVKRACLFVFRSLALHTDRGIYGNIHREATKMLVGSVIP